jgi:hypothetical protein
MAISLHELIATLEMMARMQGDNVPVEVGGKEDFIVTYDPGSNDRKPRVKIHPPHPQYDFRGKRLA